MLVVGSIPTFLAKNIMKNVFQFGSGYRAFTSFWWKHWLGLSTYWKPFHHAYQRVTRGWADCDTWNLDSWISNVLPEALDHLRENSHGYPCGSTSEKWSNILTEIADGFRAAERSKEIPEEFVQKMETSTGWREKLGVKDYSYDWDAIRAYQDGERAKFHKGMKLFVKYFHNLWD